MPEAESAAQKSTAISRIFGTEELLLLVLESVPGRDHLLLLRILKKWNSITSTIGCVVAPAFTGIDLCDDARRLIKSGAPGPRYVTDGTMRISPTIDSSAAAAPFFDGVVFIRESIGSSDKLAPLLPLMGITVVLESLQDSSKLSSKRDESITSPPMATIILGTRSQLSDVPEMNDHTSAAILRENTGIRIGHSQQSIETIASDQDPMDSACNRAFAINAILHMILSSVPKEHFANICRVSKTRNSVGHSIGYHVDHVLK